MTDEERQSLHDRLDELIDARERLERSSEKPDETEVIQVLESVATFVRDLLGGFVELDPTNYDSRVEYIEAVLRVWRVAFGAGALASLIWTAALDELARFPFGDEAVLFRPSKRNGGGSRRPGKLALYKLSALAWNEFFGREGFQPRHYQGAIVAAYGASSWDAVRKWREDFARTYDPAMIDWCIHYIAEKYRQSCPTPHYLAALFSHGVNYRVLRGYKLQTFPEYLKKLEELPADSPMRPENWRT